MKCTPAEAAMSVTRCSHLAILLLATSFTGTVPAQPSSVAAQDAKLPSAPSKVAYPQIVRVSFVEGDVRVSRGKKNEHDGGASWEQAAVNLPLEAGFSLVTGNGRAEIEFEDASTLYLGENSVLTFNDLTTQGTVPHTEMALLTGTVTVHLQPAVPGELYFLKTPTDSVHVLYGNRCDERINSYLDATTFTPLPHSPVPPGQPGPQAVILGHTFTYSYGHVIAIAPNTANGSSEWDNWVANRVAARSAAMAAVMKESGVDAPLPGLADMNAQGKFFACEPYGTCWEPNNGWVNEHDAQSAQGAAQQPDQTAASGGAAPVLDYEDDYDFPCSPYEVQDLVERDLATGQERLLRRDIDYSDYPFDWVVCHTGSWIERGGRYAWVAGGKKHHRCPVRWVKTEGKRGYVPLHPRDVAGKPPENLKHGIFVPGDKKGDTIARVAYNPSKSVDLLAETPKEFRSPPLPALRAAEEPKVEAHLFKEPSSGASGTKTPGAPRPVNTIAFDHKSQSFTLITRVTEGGKSSTFTNPMGGRVGTPQGNGPISRGGSGGGSGFGGRGGSGGGSGSGGRGGSGGGSSSSGGGSHASSGGGSSGSSGSSGGGHPR
jgi:hypothetical protein